MEVIYTILQKSLNKNNIDIFDVVDENDRVVGQKPRREVHAQGLRHRAVHILLFNEAGEVFLQKRSSLKDQHPDCWDSSCSGHLDSGEDYAEAANRELQEELGVAGFGPQLQVVEKLEACAQTGMEFVIVYQGRHDGPFVLCPKEISEGRFWTVEEVDATIERRPREFAPAFCYLWERYRSRT